MTIGAQIAMVRRGEFENPKPGIEHAQVGFRRVLTRRHTDRWMDG